MLITDQSSTWSARHGPQGGTPIHPPLKQGAFWPPFCKRLRAAGAPPREMVFVLLMRAGLWMGLTGGRDLIIDSAPIVAWRRTDPDEAVSHAPAHHPRPLLVGYRVHTLLCRGAGLPLLFRLSTAKVHDAPSPAPYWKAHAVGWLCGRA